MPVLHMLSYKGVCSDHPCTHPRQAVSAAPEPLSTMSQDLEIQCHLKYGALQGVHGQAERLLSL